MKRTQRGWNSTIRPSQTPIRRTKKAKAGRKRVLGATVSPEARWRLWRTIQRELVKNLRPMCEVPDCPRHGEQWHHPFGRIGEPWVSSYLVTVHVCFGHHEVIHRPAPTQSQRGVRDQLRVISVTRLRAWLVESAGAMFPPEFERGDDLRMHFRVLCSVANLYGLQPPGYQEVQ